MTVSVVIPHSKNRAQLEQALGALRRLDKPSSATLEIVVVSNAAGLSASWAESQGCRLISLESNEGFSRAVNRGIRAASGQWVALLNDDVIVEPGWLAPLLQALDDETLWFAYGKLLDPADRRRIDGVGDAFCRGGAAWRLGHGRRDGPAFSEPRRTYFPSATATLFRRGFFERAGLLEEAFFAYLEDVDLGLRAALEDLPGVYLPQAIAYHHGSRTGGAGSDAMVRWITTHQLLLLAKFYPGSLLLRYARRILAAQLLWCGLSVARGRASAWAKGLIEGLGRMKDIRSRYKSLRGRAARLPAVLVAGEAEIARVQRLTGFDTYWKWYFRLAWPPVRESG